MATSKRMHRKRKFEATIIEEMWEHDVRPEGGGLGEVDHFSYDMWVGHFFDSLDRLGLQVVKKKAK